MVRDTLARFTRSLPRIRGRNRLCHVLCQRMIKRGEDTGLVTISMRDGSIMRLNMASPTEHLAFWSGEYEPNVLNRLSACLGSGSVVIDVGANIGFYSIPLGRTMEKLNGKVFSFEPIPANGARLRDLVTLNNLEGIVSLIPVALGESEGELTLWLQGSDRSDTGNAVVVMGDVVSEVQGNIKARIRRLDDTAREFGIDSCRLMKIDVEGAELMALRGGYEFVQKCRPIIYAECNSYWMAKFGHSFLDVYDLLNPLKYRCYRQTVDVKFERVKTPMVGIEDVLFIPEETDDETRRRLGAVETSTLQSDPLVSRYR